MSIYLKATINSVGANRMKFIAEIYQIIAATNSSLKVCHSGADCKRTLQYSPNDKILLDVFIDDEVQVSLSVAGLLVLQTKVKVR